ncbi:MAG TPA: hypothetical protein VIM69_10515 [Opitutaceae bacterium]
MIYLEYEAVGSSDRTVSYGVELNVKTINEAAQLFMAFEAGLRWCEANVSVTLTSVGTSKKRGVSYERWSGL